MPNKTPHPGWAIKFGDGDWLFIAHGCSGGEVELAHIFKSEEEAKQFLEEENFAEPCEIVVAWEPLVAKLRSEIADLKKVNTFSPRRLQDVKFSLEEIKADLDRAIYELDK